MKFAWIDLRAVPQPNLESVVDAAIHARIQGVLSDLRAPSPHRPADGRSVL